jgi:hypothetical protein
VRRPKDAHGPSPAITTERTVYLGRNTGAVATDLDRLARGEPLHLINESLAGLTSVAFQALSAYPVLAIGSKPCYAAIY